MSSTRKKAYSFSSIEELDSVQHNMGWSTEYRQLEPGCFRAAFTLLESDHWFLIEEQPTRTVEVACPAPNGMAMLALLEGGSTVANSQQFGCNHLLVVPAESDLQALIPPGVRVTQLGVLADEFECVARAIAPLMSCLHGDASTIAIASGKLARLRTLMRAVLFAPSHSDDILEETVSEILTGIVATALDHHAAPVNQRLHRAAAQRARNRAMEYIEAHLGGTIRMPEVCNYAGTTLRSLERSFSRELGMSPQQYVKCRRLNAVRRCLYAADREQGTKVAEVATRYGFAHMGRFAGDYHRHFGEYPRETLLNG